VDPTLKQPIEREPRPPRVTFRGEVSFWISNSVTAANDDEGQPPAPVSGEWASADISEKGLKIRCEEFVAPQTQLILNIRLYQEKAVTLAGQVVWVQKNPHAEYYTAGVEFTGTPANTEPKAELRNYIRNRHKNISQNNEAAS
jgi:hypothetical protein